MTPNRESLLTDEERVATAQQARSRAARLTERVEKVAIACYVFTVITVGCVLIFTDHGYFGVAFLVFMALLSFVTCAYLDEDEWDYFDPNEYSKWLDEEMLRKPNDSQSKSLMSGANSSSL